MNIDRKTLITTLASGAAAFTLTGPAGAQADARPRLPPLATSLKPEETALVMVDFQNSFAAVGGEHYKTFEKMFTDTGFIQNAVGSVKDARRKGIQVIHVTEAYTPNYRELDYGNPGGFHRAQIARQSWKMGSSEVQLLDAMKPGPNDNDMLYPNRTTANGFMSNGLDLMLKSRGIRNVAVGGFVTEVCCYATILGGYDLGYRMYALQDLNADLFPQLAPQLWKYTIPYWSRVMTAAAFGALFT
jgi:ureidoacrylate peracid hydrolase